jgi:hypothetical protein
MPITGRITAKKVKIMINPNQNLNLPAPLTAAAQFLQSRTMEGAAVSLTPVVPAAPATAEGLRAIEADSQTYSDPEAPSLGMYPAKLEEAIEEPAEPAQLYDYESDGVFSSPTTTLLSWIERGPLVPGGRVKRQYIGNRVELALNLSIQKPSVTARQAQQRAKELAKESEVILQVSGSALLEAIKETYEAVEIIKPDKEAARAIAVTCMQLVTYYSERDNSASATALPGAIHQKHPDILKDAQFRSTMKRFGKDPAQFKQDFANIPQLEAMIKALPMVPAFHEFTEAHNINIEEVFGGAL